MGKFIPVRKIALSSGQCADRKINLQKYSTGDCRDCRLCLSAELKMRHEFRRKLSLFGWAVLLVTGSLCAGLCSTQAQAQAPAQKPNVLFIMGDDSARIAFLSSNDSKEKNDYTKVSNALCH
jgi:hypothetical protein